MSFILDALRKSETARRRSEAPDLFTAMPSAPEPLRVRAQWPLWALGLVGALSLIAALWLFAHRAPLSASGGSTNDVAENTSATTSAETQSIVVQPAATVAVMPAPTTAPALPITPRISPSAPALSPPTPDITPTRELPAPPEPFVAPPPAPPITPAALPASDQMVSLSDLDPGSRKQLPPLKLSMHLWNETASQRFVILDGQRLKEGDMLGEIVIERITREGAVLAWRGSRLKIAL